MRMHLPMTYVSFLLWLRTFEGNSFNTIRIVQQARTYPPSYDVLAFVKHTKQKCVRKPHLQRANAWLQVHGGPFPASNRK